MDFTYTFVASASHLIRFELKSICGSGYGFPLYNEMGALYLGKAPLTLPTDWEERRVIVHIDSPNNAEKPL